MELSELTTFDVRFLCKTFAHAGFQARIVGGAVRNAILGIPAKDIDLATDATPEFMIDIAKAANIPYIPTGLKHGTLTFLVNGVTYEVTTLRVDVETDGRHAEVEFTTDWRADAARRDLTINAMSYDPLTGELFDYFDGADDLNRGIIRFVGDATERITEDYLRILRFFRFFGRFSALPVIPYDTMQAFKRLGHCLERISGERIWMEMRQILAHASAPRVLKNMQDAIVLPYTFPVCLWDEAAFVKTCDLTVNPITRLAVIVPDDVGPLNERLKLSTDEMKLLTFLTANRTTPLTLGVLQDMATTKNHGHAFAIELAAMRGDPHLHELIRNWEVKVFPVSGRDLLDMGMTPGPAMGKVLATLERLWKDQGYSLGKQELMALVTV